MDGATLICGLDDSLGIELYATWLDSKTAMGVLKNSLGESYIPLGWMVNHRHKGLDDSLEEGYLWHNGYKYLGTK